MNHRQRVESVGMVSEPGRVVSPGGVHGEPVDCVGGTRHRGGAAKRFNQLDTYVWRRLHRLRLARKTGNLRAGESRWTRDSFHRLGLIRLRATVRYPERAFWEAV